MKQKRQVDRIKIVTFYRFVSLPEHLQLAPLLRDRGERAGLTGTLILAEEGINATLAGEPEKIDQWMTALASDARFADLRVRESFANEMPFFRLKVKVRKEIVTLGQAGVKPHVRTGKHVPPAQWNELLDDPDVTIIDTRNQFEVGVGTFDNATDPQTQSFGEFPEYVASHLDPQRHKKIAMFCTGGIRCEKASAWMLEQGFEEVYQLSGGILAYLEQVPSEAGRWNGSCFVFDQRVAVEYGLEFGKVEACFGCRHPLTEQDLASNLYEPGVSCPHCSAGLSEGRRAALRERQHQMRLAKERGVRHIGSPLASRRKA